MTPFRTTLADWLHYLERLHPSAIDMGLERVREVAYRLLDLSALPPSVTVTGTNGKGSTVLTMESVALAHSVKAGAYLSPHLLRYNERVRINGIAATDRALIESFEAVEIARQSTSITYFEFGTLSALWLFARANLDVLFLEVGLGGRLDAVNIVQPAVSIIASIGLDHADWLGNTLEEVCYEKAGIRRTGIPLVCGEASPPDNLYALTAETSTPLCLLGRDYGFSGETGVKLVSVAENNWKLPDSPILPSNMACGLQALKLLDLFPLDSTIVHRTLSRLRVQGRRQLLQHLPEVYVDVAHNPHAAASLKTWIEEKLKTTGEGRIIALVGMLADKDYTGVLETLNTSIDLWQPVTLSSGRGLNGEVLASILTNMDARCLPVQSSPVHGLIKVLEHADKNDTIVAFGSFYTVSDILSYYPSESHGS